MDDHFNITSEELVSSPGQMFHVHPVASSKNRVWTFSLVKLGPNNCKVYCHVVPIGLLREVNYAYMHVITDSQLADFWVPKLALLVNDKVCQLYGLVKSVSTPLL